MTRPEYRSVEGQLYALGRPPEASGTRPHPHQQAASVRFSQAQGTPPVEVIHRLDLHIGVARLLPEDRQVITEHYILGSHPHRGQDRRRALEHLIELLDDT